MPKPFDSEKAITAFRKIIAERDAPTTAADRKKLDAEAKRLRPRRSIGTATMSCTRVAQVASQLGFTRGPDRNLLIVPYRAVDNNRRS